MGRRAQLPGLMLKDTVQRTDAGIADDDRDGHDTKAHGQIPPVQIKRFEREAKHRHSNQQGEAQHWIENCRKKARKIKRVPRLRNGDRTRDHLRSGFACLFRGVFDMCHGLS